ncbi:MAG: aldo/keto reductase [Azoarcus sp.]|jgi:aryl-alcohol dehydrogenase-like predicted oxidoreductase|nr:aldo/keto reductase [Azoarcus sp.]
MQSKQKLALGTAQFGLSYGVANQNGKVAFKEVQRILSRAREAAIRVLDTAIGYGESEIVLGKIGISDFHVVSKLPGLPPDCPDIGQWVRRELANSLARLRIDHLEALLLHRPAQLQEARGEALYTALRDVQASGLVRKIGISIYTPDELDLLMARFEVDLVQAPLNLLDRRLVDSGWAARLTARSVELHTRSCFLQGLLLMSPTERPPGFQRFAACWRDWETWLRDTGLSPLKACLRYALSQSEARQIIIGIDSSTQMDEILATAEEDALPNLPVWTEPPDPLLLNPSCWSAL